MNASDKYGRIEVLKNSFEKYRLNFPETDGLIIFRLHAKPE